VKLAKVWYYVGKGKKLLTGAEEVRPLPKAWQMFSNNIKKMISTAYPYVPTIPAFAE